jgi:hypothetical protein
MARGKRCGRLIVVAASGEIEDALEPRDGGFIRDGEAPGDSRGEHLEGGARTRTRLVARVVEDPLGDSVVLAPRFPHAAFGLQLATHLNRFDEFDRDARVSAMISRVMADPTSWVVVSAPPC